jgi:shikimate kinase
MNAETRTLITKHAIAIWLKASLDVLVTRTSRRKTRPLLAEGNTRAILAKLLKERGPIYAQAAIHVPTGKGPHEEVVDNILTQLTSYLNERGAG